MNLLIFKNAFIDNLYKDFERLAEEHIVNHYAWLDEDEWEQYKERLIHQMAEQSTMMIAAAAFKTIDKEYMLR